MMSIFRMVNPNEESMELKNFKSLLNKVDATHFAFGEHDYKNYSIELNDYCTENPKKYILNISTLRCIILQTIYFDEATEAIQYLNNVTLKIEKDIWP